MSPARKSITALQGIERHTAHLDARSLVASEFVQVWLRLNSDLRPTMAVVVRRALVLLAEHLSHLDEAAHITERRAFVDAGKGHGTARSLTEARARIEDHIEAPARQPMAHWMDALQSKADREESRRMLEAMEAAMARLDAAA